MNKQVISADFPFNANYLQVDGSNIHYVDEGSGDPILFLHGNPSSSYLWRNIIPHVTHIGRAIAPDLIGMGKSDKPALNYHFDDQYRYLTGFIDALGLTNITLVLHDWGSGLGFHYAAENPDKIKAIACMESMLRPIKWSDFDPEFRVGFRLMRTPGIGWLMISLANMFIKQIVPQAVERELTPQEKAAYAAPYPTIASRKPIRRWPCEIPINGTPSHTHTIISRYSQWLQETEIPKLLFYAQPGGLIKEETVKWARQYLPNLETVDIGRGLHYVQEDNPHQIGEELASWLQQKVKADMLTV